MAAAGASVSKSRARKRLTCGAIRISRFDSTIGGRGASGASRYASHSLQNTGSDACTSSQNRSYREARRSQSCRSAKEYPGTPRAGVTRLIYPIDGTPHLDGDASCARGTIFHLMRRIVIAVFALLGLAAAPE